MKKIKCPVCGWEYHPAEIYVPTAFFGHPKNIIKSENGEIEHFMGEDSDLKEAYVCDHCNTHFLVEASVSFNTTVDPSKEFSEEYVSELYSTRITLQEK